jgi:hypothetical protein
VKPYAQIGEELRHLVVEESPPSFWHFLFGIFLVVMLTGALERI